VLAHLPVTVGVVGWAGKLGFGALLEPLETLIPTLDDLAFAYSEIKRSATIVTRIELSSIGQRAPIVSLNLVTFLDWLSRSLLKNLDIELNRLRVTALTWFLSFFCSLWLLVLLSDAHNFNSE